MRRLQSNRRCDGILRRDVLRVGGLSAFGLSLNHWFQARAAAGQPEATADSCILIWLDGGPSHLETFDLKPDAPEEVRGPFSPTATNVPGIQIGEYFERTATVMDKMAIIRSMTSTLGEHNFASHYLLTGYKPSPALVYPGLPSVVTHFHGGPTAIPNNVALQKPNGMAGPGYLNDSTSPFVVEGDPSKPGFKVRDLTASVTLSSDRMDRRRSFREQIDQMAGQAQQQGADASFDQAYRLIASTEAREAFDLNRERESVQARYGKHQLGQSCLMARRLIEAGTKFVTVTDRGWDTHENLFTRLREGYSGGTVGKIPKLDVALSALLEDLDDRGLLDTTMVLVMGEFGRTPKLNPRGGRDHWPRAFSVALAGGGIRGGQVIGASDSRGERPADRPVSPADLARTVYHALGIDGNLELQTNDGRPVQINRDGSLIDELIA
ncbi:MAG: DUF1501 domain-containing protein [Planctomycetota bacterium]